MSDKTNWQEHKTNTGLDTNLNMASVDKTHSGGTLAITVAGLAQEAWCKPALDNVHKNQRFAFRQAQCRIIMPPDDSPRAQEPEAITTVNAAELAAKKLVNRDDNNRLTSIAVGLNEIHSRSEDRNSSIKDVFALAGAEYINSCIDKTIANDPSDAARAAIDIILPATVMRSDLKPLAKFAVIVGSHLAVRTLWEPTNHDKGKD